MATTHSPGFGSGDVGHHGRRAAVVAAVVLAAAAAIVIPFAFHGLDRDGAHASPATDAGPSPVTTTAGHREHRSGDLGPRGDLPAMLPAARSGLTDGARVRVGDVTEGVARRTPGGHGGWQVMVRWNGRLQPLATRSPVPLGTASPATGAAYTTWISAGGQLYTRVATGTPGRFHVYAWDPQGGSVYTPPTLVATDLGRVCFDRAFTAFGDCRRH